MNMMPLKDTHQGIIDDLRDQALTDALELGENPQSMPAWDAADLIEELMSALQKIADGAPDSQDIARRALDPFARMITNYATGKTGSG